MKTGRFEPGPDARRKAGGRRPSAASIARSVRLELGQDVATIVGKVRTLALSGDPEGLLAASILIASTAGSSRAPVAEPGVSV